MTLQSAWNEYLGARLAEMPVLAQSVATQTRERVQVALGNGSDCGQRQHLLALDHTLGAESTSFVDALTAALRRQVSDDLRRTEASDPPAGARPSQPRAVDDRQLERDIELARVIQLVETSAEWELRHLQALCATLRRARSIRPEHNPLRPEVCARAFLFTLEDAALTCEARVLALSIGGAVLAAVLREAYAQHARQLSQLVIPARSSHMQVAAARMATGHDAMSGPVARTVRRVDRRRA